MILDRCLLLQSLDLILRPHEIAHIVRGGTDAAHPEAACVVATCEPHILLLVLLPLQPVEGLAKDAAVASVLLPHPLGRLLKIPYSFSLIITFLALQNEIIRSIQCWGCCTWLQSRSILVSLTL